jgi:hypothetical protein
VTLRFLGEAPELREPLLQNALEVGGRVDQPAFDLYSTTPTSFPGPRPPWVLRCREHPEAIRSLGQSLVVPGAPGDKAIQDFIPRCDGVAPCRHGATRHPHRVDYMGGE